MRWVHLWINTRVRVLGRLGCTVLSFTNDLYLFAVHPEETVDEEREGEAEAESPIVPGQMRMRKTKAEAEEERAVSTEQAGIATFALPEGEEEGKKVEEEEEAIGEEMEVAIRARTEETDQEIASSHFATSPRWKTWMKSSCASPANCRS